MTLLDFEERCASGLKAAQTLAHDMFADLDLEQGGFSWWQSYFDPAHRVWASDYSYALVRDLSHRLRQASFALKQFAEGWYSEEHVIGSRNTLQPEAFVDTSPEGKRRDERIDASIGTFFTSCGSVLDELAGAAVMVLGLGTDLVTVSWKDIARGENGKARATLGPSGTPGRERQEAVLSALWDRATHGPDGWLKWTLSMRNLLVHRAPRMSWKRFYRTDRLHMVLPLPKNPELTDAEAVILAHNEEDVLLKEHASVTMTGVLELVNDLLAATAQDLTVVWRERRRDPGLIAQSRQQWKTPFPKRRGLSGFEGFEPGTKIPTTGRESVAIHPDEGARWKAAKMLDADRSFWDSVIAKYGAEQR